MKISVATVCFNSQDSIAKTIESVLKQTYSEIEYIIVDGASKDDTLSIVNGYDDKRMIVISEPDKGLYDAMNKAANMSSGEYILYMNSGDVFADVDAIERMVPFLDGDNEIVYGNVIRCREKGEELESYRGKHIEMGLLLSGKMMCHQSIFTKTSVMREYGFDLNYSITADYDFIMRAMHDKRKFKYVNDVTVSKVESVEGISSLTRNMDIMRAQDDKSLKANFPMLYCLVTPPKAVIRFFRRISEKRKI